MERKNPLFRYIVFPLAVGAAELAADGLLPSSKGVTSPFEEISEGFISAEAGVIMGIFLYRAICRKKGIEINNQSETGYAILGGVVGLLAMTSAGLVLHQMLGVSDIRWFPR